jgi:uncharacterized DUF497 family protein
VPKLVFDWDPHKAVSNRRKHGVSFEDARTVFDDPLALFIADWEHDEPRIIAIGTARSARILFVVSVELEDDVIRIISARRATKSERKQYEEGE